MRIIHFLNHTRHCNGHVHVAIDLACVQSKKGHSVTVISGGGAFDALLADYGVEHIIIDQSRSPSKLAKAAYEVAFHDIVVFAGYHTHPHDDEHRSCLPPSPIHEIQASDHRP